MRVKKVSNTATPSMAMASQYRSKSARPLRSQTEFTEDLESSVPRKKTCVDLTDSRCESHGQNKYEESNNESIRLDCNTEDHIASTQIAPGRKRSSDKTGTDVLTEKRLRRWL